MTRTGKIARLPREIRDELNRRLLEGEPGQRLVEWLNARPETTKLLAADFEGRAISEQNLSEWKQGGHREWLTRREALEQARELAADAKELTEAMEGRLTDHLALVLSARYAALVSGGKGEMDEEFRREARAQRALCQDIVELRRGDHCAGRLRLDLERFEDAKQDDLDRALKAVTEELKQWPEVKKAFDDAFALHRQHNSGGPPARPAPEPVPVRLNQT